MAEAPKGIATSVAPSNTMYSHVQGEPHWKGHGVWHNGGAKRDRERDRPLSNNGSGIDPGVPRAEEMTQATMQLRVTDVSTQGVP